MSDRLHVGDLDFALRFSSRRRTMQITVGRSGELLEIAPEGCERAELERFARDKRFWIYTKLAEKEALRQPIRAREYVNGEGFSYLGRSHRLRLVSRQDAPLKLVWGRFRLLRGEAQRGRGHSVDWYSEHGRAWLDARVPRWAAQIGAEATGIDVRDLGFRWGSCSKAGVLNIHWATILLPPPVVDYAIVHELVHLCETHHTQRFWKRVERAMPDFARRKQWLAEHAMSVATV